MEINVDRRRQTLKIWTIFNRNAIVIRVGNYKFTEMIAITGLETCPPC